MSSVIPSAVPVASTMNETLMSCPMVSLLTMNVRAFRLRMNGKMGRARFRIDSALVRKVRGDLEAYAQLGSVLSEAELVSLLGVAKSLKDEYERVNKATSRRMGKPQPGF